jgi:hypothetical protein
MAKLRTILQDWRGQLSWGRVCAAVALVVAVWREFNGADLAHVGLWLGVALGNYGVSKLTEVRCSKSPNPGAPVPSPAADGVSSTSIPSTGERS